MPGYLTKTNQNTQTDNINLTCSNRLFYWDKKKCDCMDNSHSFIRWGEIFF